jgi:5-methylcytosine-specific restriction endonuclease McrA
MKHLKTLRSDKIRAYEAKYRAKMYDWVNRTKNRNRVKNKGLDGDFSVQQWKELVAKYDGKCANCGKEGKLTYDHIIALSKWVEWASVNHPNYRANDIENIQPLCSRCNESKGNK